MNPIRLYFELFSVNQLLSPIISEYRLARKRLLLFHQEIFAQMPKNARVDSRKLPVGIYIKYYTTKDHYLVENFSLITYQIIKTLVHFSILQSNNLDCIDGVAYDVELVSRQQDEGCEIVFISHKN